MLSEEELGFTRLLFDYAYLIALLMPLGMPNTIVKYFPVYKDRTSGHRGFAGVVLSVFLLGFVLSSVFLFSFGDELGKLYTAESFKLSQYFKFLLPFTVILAAIAVTTSYCQSLFKSTVPSFLNDIMVRVGIMLVTILYFNHVINFNTYVIFFISIYGLELLLLVGFILIVDRPSIMPDRALFSRAQMLPMLRFGLILSLASFASYALRKVDAIILGAASLGLAGIYTTAVFIAAFIEVPLAALDRISHTRISASFAAHNLNDIGKIYSESVRYLLLAGGFLFVGINACTRHIYELGNLPQSFMATVDVVYLVGVGALVNVSTGVNSAIMFYSKHYLLGAFLMVLSLAATILLNLWLIPIYGIYGAAIASLCGATLYNLIKYVFIYRTFGFQPYTFNAAKILLLIIACTGLAHVLPEVTDAALINLIYKAIAVTVVYVGAAWQLKLAPEIFEALIRRLQNVSGRK